MQVQNLKPEACYKIVVTDEQSAKLAMQAIIKYFSTAFHPDTRAADYVDIVTGKAVFEPFEAENLDKNLDLISDYFDLYDTAIAILEENGMMPGR